MENKIPEISVVYALPRKQFVKTVKWMSGLTALEAVIQSGLIEAIEQFFLESSELNQADFWPANLEELHLGSYGRKLGAADLVSPLDRIEIYRPLLVDPKQRRLERYRQQKFKRIRRLGSY